jgi:hypothetical protein
VIEGPHHCKSYKSPSRLDSHMTVSHISILHSILISRISSAWLALVDADNAIDNVSKLFPIPLSSLSMIANVLPAAEALGVQSRIYYQYLRLQGCVYSSSPISFCRIRCIKMALCAPSEVRKCSISPKSDMYQCKLPSQQKNLISPDTT